MVSYSHIVLHVALLAEVALLSLPGFSDDANTLVLTSRRVRGVERLQARTDNPRPLAAAAVPLRNAAFPLLLLLRIAQLADQAGELPPLSRGRSTLRLLDKVLDRLGDDHIVEQRQQDGGRDAADTGAGIEGGQTVRRALGRRRRSQGVREGGQLRQERQQEQARGQLVDVGDRLASADRSTISTHSCAETTEHAVDGGVNLVPVLDTLHEVGSRRAAAQGRTHVRTGALRRVLDHGQ